MIRLLCYSSPVDRRAYIQTRCRPATCSFIITCSCCSFPREELFLVSEVSDVLRDTGRREPGHAQSSSFDMSDRMTDLRKGNSRWESDEMMVNDQSATPSSHSAARSRLLGHYLLSPFQKQEIQTIPDTHTTKK